MTGAADNHQPRRSTKAALSRFLVLLLAACTLSATTAAAGTTSRAADGCTKGAGDLRFRASDGTRLVGHRFGTGRVAIVLAHQSDGDLCQWVSYATRLAHLGYSALAFDLRGHGASERRSYPANQRYGGDVTAAVKLVRRLGAKKVFLIGASLGGSAVLDAAANVLSPVDGVVSVSGSAGLANAIVAVGQLRAPVLFLAGGGDIEFASDARRLYAATASNDKRLTILPHASEHGTQLVDAKAQARTLIERFLDAH